MRSRHRLLRLIAPLCLALLGAASVEDDPVLTQTRLVQSAIKAGFAGHLALVVHNSVASLPMGYRATYGDVSLEAFSYRLAHFRDVWRFASVTKQIVAVAVMQQVEAGTLALDTPVARYAPKLGIANADRITIRQLLQHTSGLPNPEDGPQADGQLVQYSRAAPPPVPGVAPICRAPAKAEPGSGFSYNNCDYEVLGAVLEAVTHQSLPRLLQERIFGPRA